MGQHRHRPVLLRPIVEYQGVLHYGLYGYG